MYRQSADPNVTEELHALGVSTAKGGTLVGVLAGLALVVAVTIVVMLVAGDPGELAPWEWMMAALAAVLAVSAYRVQRRRRRKLRIVRHGEALRLVVPEAGVELQFPLDCRGTQYTTRINRVPVHEVYLQLVDGRRRAVLLHETRGAIHGPQEGWFPETTDRSVASEVFDVPGAGTLATIRDWVERLNRADEAAPSGQGAAARPAS